MVRLVYVQFDSGSLNMTVRSSLLCKSHGVNTLDCC